jgi:hypothetical protein
LAPAFLYRYFATQGFGREAWSKIAKGALPFLAGLSPYLYLPLRAAAHPAMDWGAPSEPLRLWDHVSGGQFHYLMFASPQIPLRKLAEFLSAFPSEFAYLPLAFAGIGLWRLSRENRGLLIFSLLIFLGCLLYTFNYDLEDQDYYLNAYLSTAIWIAFGVRAVFQAPKLRGWPAALLCAACPLFPLSLNARQEDKSRDYVVEDYARNMLDELDTNAIILSRQYDYFISPSYYLQLVEKFRPDVAVIHEDLLRRSWYYSQLETRHPWLIRNSRDEIQRLLPGLHLFERGLPYDTPAVQEDYEKVARSFLVNNYGTRPVYVTFDIEPGFTEGFQRVPAGLALRLLQGNIPQPPPFKDFSLHNFPPRVKAFENEIKRLYAQAYANDGVYRAYFGDTALGRAQLYRSLRMQPGFPPALAWLQRLGG